MSPGESFDTEVKPSVAVADVKAAAAVADYEAVVNEARDASDLESNMTLREALRCYPKAVFWSLCLSTAIVMEGFDVVLLGSFYALPTFVRDYGELQPDGTYNISSAWQAGLSNAVQVGSIIGLLINGWASDRFGYKKTMIAALFAMILTILVPVLSNGRIEVLLVGEFLMGIPWGVFQTLTCAYAADIAPQALRPILTTYVNLCWVMGQLLASGVLRGLLSRTDKWAYVIPWCLQWMWPPGIILACIFAPESPWWLVRKGRIEEAKQVLRSVTSPYHTAFDADKATSLMVHTNALEKSMTEGTNYIDCLRGVDRRRTEIACVVWAIQNLSGSAFMGYSTYFLQQAGFATERAFDMSLAQYAIGFIGTVGSWFFMPHFGRRTIFVYGLAILFVTLLTIGFLGLAPGNASALWAVGAMLLVYTFVYDITIGPVTYCLVAEMGSTRLRAKTIVLARCVYNVSGIINAVIMPQFLNTDALNWGAKTGWFWAGMCGLCFIYAFFRLPEPKGRTYGELDCLFEQRVSARKFKHTAVNQFSEGHHPGASSVSSDKRVVSIEHKEFS
ncbi:general substrate transporter [Leucosporidium creatinivorum]|uniref:General substrate transporter n=1 Tax=Leucosporidium creatinivorum TaxID=106004 RepID=A0A1Y2FWR7_9BASI|nr:general substrate transporter [Leucosporidium creatinivorum]